MTAEITDAEREITKKELWAKIRAIRKAGRDIAREANIAACNVRDRLADEDHVTINVEKIDELAELLLSARLLAANINQRVSYSIRTRDQV